MDHRLVDVATVRSVIASGTPLLLAGEEAALRQLPAGGWIAGTSPYFMTEAGGCADRARVFMSTLPAGLTCASIRRYGERDIDRVYADLPADGFGVMVVPSGSRVALAFALNAPGFDAFASRPLVGWVSGVHLDELGRATPRVFDGTAAQGLDAEAVVMHVRLPPGKTAEVGIVNLFEPGDGPTFVFPESGFAAGEVLVDGQRRNLAAYVAEAGLDTRLPLVADYFGTSINVSFQAVDATARAVRFYAPVFAGLPYRHARPIGDYVQGFAAKVPGGLATRLAFSCNCILNYLHGGLEGRSTSGITGPITFGEIAYQLLNQTMVYVTVEDANRA